MISLLSRFRRYHTSPHFRAHALVSFAMLLWSLGQSVFLRPSLAQDVLDEPSHFRAHIVRVEAGDRIVVRLQNWDVTIQLHGVSCPLRPPEARAKARDYTSRRVLDTDADIEVRGTGARATIYGEVVAADGRSLNQELVRVGLAMWARAYAPNRNDLALLQTEARNAHRGIWSDPTAANVPLPAPPAPSQHPHSSATPHATPHPATPAPTARPTVKPAPMTTHPAVHPASAIAADASVSPHGDSRPLAAAIFAGIFAVLAAAIVAGTGFSPRRLPFQLGVALCATFGFALLLPLLVGAISLPPGAHSPANAATIVAILPPIILLCSWAAVALPRQEQILRGATTLSLDAVTDSPATEGGADTFGPGLVRVAGVADGLLGQEPFVSAVGAIPAIHLHEVTQIFEAVEHSTPQRQRRYAWKTLHNETRVGDFVLADPNGESPSVVVEAARAQFHTRHVARFYNEVPVEQWFARPYPGDTRTEVTFIPPDSPLVVWGRVRRMPSADGGDENRLVYDGLQEMLVVAEGDGSIVWTRRPLLGLLLTLVTICLIAVCAYLAASTPSPRLTPGSSRPFALGETAGLLSFWVGASILVSLTLKARAALGALRKTARHWKTLDDVLDRRRERLYALFSRDHALIEACRSAEQAKNPEDRIDAESEIDERLRRYLAGGSMPLGPNAEPEAVRIELVDWRGRVASAAARYNDAVRTVAILRRSFPAGLLLRARDLDDPAPYGPYL